MGSTSGNDEPAPGDVLGGRYEILEELGRGGMATVYKGRDLRLSRKVAVKVFRGGFADAMDPRRTAQEMRLLAGVDHPSIVSVLDASNDDGRFGTYLVMELVVGDDLGALLKRARGPLSADFARRIVADVASALELLHSKGVVHRDVKPGNILVSAGAGQHGMSGVTAKLTDFGIAQMVDGAALTAPDSILGTAAYLSPEQVRGTRLRPASDIYSLGLVLLESLTGRRAFPGPAAEAAVARLTRPPALPADASPGLADLLSRMTALDPGDRPRAAEVAEALHEQLAGAITVPDATHTVEVPRADLPSVLERGEDETLPHERSWTPGTGIPLSAPSLDTGPRPQLVPVGERAPGSRSRFPTVLAVGASALAAAVAGILISSSAGLLNAPSGAVAAGDAGAKDGVSASSPAPARSSSSSAPVRVATGGGVVATTPHASPSPTPRRSSSTPSTSSSPTPTATPSSSASGSPDPTTSSSAPATPSAPPSSDPAPSGSTSAPGSTSPTPTDTDSGGPGSGGNGASADSASPSTVSADGAFPDASA